ncbi:MAG TPA: radical SAM protein [Thermodesulfobacteriota bacterium]|nr:radical SAM protein [Thermodesulfobacteriota bacterium]
MARERRLIIPIFIPFGGCPHRCVFCDQEGITGFRELPSTKEVRETIDACLATWKGAGRGGSIEAAFYGGSFTALPAELQAAYLECAGEYIEKGLIHSTRLSTRPDSISEEGVELLLSYGVGTVELGAQSMSEEVLRLSGRGHTPADTVRAVEVLKSRGITVGVQFMPGLPGDTFASVLETTREVIRLSPGFVRVYPTLVVRGTPLEKMYREGRYTPWTLEEMAGVCRSVLDMLEEAGVRVARMGLQHTEELGRSVVAGPYHPSFRDLVQGLRKPPGAQPGLLK